MKKIYWVTAAGLAMVIFLMMPVLGFASDKEGESFWESIHTTNLLIGRYTKVEGNVEKFRTHHWMKDGFASGINDFLMEKVLPNDVHMSWEAEAIPQENNIESAFHLDKKDLGFLVVHYKAFRKYFEGSGGHYHNFTTFPVPNGDPAKLQEDLKMDMGHLAVEFGPHLEGGDLSFSYEQHTKDGRKSRLSWTGVKEDLVTRRVGPSWQDVDEVTNIFGIKGGTDISGFTVTSDNQYETVHITSLREEASLANTSFFDSDKKIMRQDQEPQSNLLTTTWNAQRWLFNDQAFVNFGYRYYQLRGREDENLSAFTNLGAPLSDSHTRIGAMSNTDFDTHSFISHFTNNVTKALNFVAKMKIEAVKRRGDSFYPSDTTNPPDGKVNDTAVSKVEDRLYRIGENFALRYTGIPKTALYTELDLEQTRGRLAEERISVAGQSSASTTDTFSRETVNNSDKAVWTLGGRYVPLRQFNMTAQLRHRLEKNDYDDQGESVHSSTAKSAFFDSLNVNGDEASIKMTLKPYQWLEPSFRYQYIVNKYIARVENQDSQVSRVLWNVFSYDVNWIPSDKFLVTTSYSMQNISTTTPASSYTTTPQPGFDSNVSTWMVSASYSPRQNLNIINSFLYSKAGKFNDFSDTGMPFGIDSDRYDYTLGVRWEPRKDWKVEPHYSYYEYDPHLSIEKEGYKAHVLWLDLDVDW